MNKVYIIFYFLINSLAWGQTQVIPSLQASASNLATAGAIPYVSSPGVLNINAANLFWDNTNARLGVGTNAPGENLSIYGATGNVDQKIETGGTGSVGARLRLKNSTSEWYIYNVQSTGSLRFFVGGRDRMVLTTAGAYGIGSDNNTPSTTTTLSVLDATASTGATATWIGHDGSGTYSGVHLSALTTKLTVVEGLTQGSTNLIEVQSKTGTALVSIDNVGSPVFLGNVYAGGAYRVANNQIITFSNGANFTNTSLSRIGDGIIGVGTGAAGSTGGTIQAAKYIGTLTTPASAAATCTAGTIVADTGFVYVCTATDTWKRVAIATW